MKKTKALLTDLSYREYVTWSIGYWMNAMFPQTCACGKDGTNCMKLFLNLVWQCDDCWERERQAIVQFLDKKIHRKLNEYKKKDMII